MTERPGIILYFDKWEPMLKLPDNEIGSLFRAALLYSRYGELPEFSDFRSILWEMIRPGLDYDATRYEHSNKQKRYAVYCREERKQGREPLAFADWIERLVSDDLE